MTKYTPTIGIEIHAELKTKTKMFCNSKNDPEEKKPNINICPVCIGHPGTLPVINKEAVKHVLRVGLAVKGTLADKTNFDRKNYFYPDLPKGYQISQYEFPLVLGGVLNGVELERIHLEEDTARSIHSMENKSLVDFNRAGVPLMELVTKPVVKSAKETSMFAKEFQLLLRYLDVSDANMEKGEMRVEANISISDSSKLGTKVEVKNLNSFKAVEKAINFEIKRQEQILEKGEKVIQETRGWDENKEKTFSQRIKEESQDYRYFPDPDLPHLKLSEIPEFDHTLLQKSIFELPWERRTRLRKNFDLQDEAIEIFVNNKILGDFFQNVANFLKDDIQKIKLASNYITSDLLKLIKISDTKNDIGVDSEGFSQLISLLSNNEISSRGAKDILAYMFKKGGNPKKIAEVMGLLQENNKEKLVKIVRKIIRENTGVADDYKGGKEKAIKFLMGQAMKESRGSANPQMVENILKKELS